MRRRVARWDAYASTLPTPPGPHTACPVTHREREQRVVERACREKAGDCLEGRCSPSLRGRIAGMHG